MLEQQIDLSSGCRVRNDLTTNLAAGIRCSMHVHIGEPGRDRRQLAGAQCHGANEATRGPERSTIERLEVDLYARSLLGRCWQVDVRTRRDSRKTRISDVEAQL